MSSAVSDVAPACAVHPHLDAVFACSRCGSFGCAECRGHDEATHCGPCMRRLSEDPGAMSPTRLIQDAFRLLHQHASTLWIVMLAQLLAALGGVVLVFVMGHHISTVVLIQLLVLQASHVHLMRTVVDELREPGRSPPDRTRALWVAVSRTLLMLPMYALYGLLLLSSMFLLLLPAFYVALCTSLSSAAVAVDAKGPLASLRLSYKLVRGHRLRLLGTLVPLQFALFIVSMVSSRLFALTYDQPGVIQVMLVLPASMMMMAALALHEVTRALAYQRLLERQSASQSSGRA